MTWRTLLKEEAHWVAEALRTPWFGIILAGAVLWVDVTVGVFSLQGGALVGLGALLGVLTCVDIRYQMMPMTVNAALVLSGFGVAVVGGSVPVGQSVMGALLAFGGLWGCALLTSKMTGKESTGGADIWLVAGLGAWGGALCLPLLLVMVSVLGALTVGVRRVLGRTGPFAFGPILALAGWAAVLHGESYWRVVGLFTRHMAGG